MPDAFTPSYVQKVFSPEKDQPCLRRGKGVSLQDKRRQVRHKGSRNSPGCVDLYCTTMLGSAGGNELALSTPIQGDVFLFLFLVSTIISLFLPYRTQSIMTTRSVVDLLTQESRNCAFLVTFFNRYFKTDADNTP